MKDNIYHVSVLPYRHGIYKVAVEMNNGMKVTLVVTDMEIIDQWKDGNQEPLYEYILRRVQ
jgi:hypothetical protein